MKKGIFLGILSFCVLLVAAQERSFQLWNQNGLEIKLNDKYSVGANEKIHYRPETGNITLKFGDLYLKRKFTSWFDVGLAGRILWLNTDQEWLRENRPMIYGNVEMEAGRFLFELSNRLEYRMYKDLNDHFRHRHMVSVETFPITEAPWFTFYLSEEGFYLPNENEFHLIRFYSGTRFKWSKAIEMKLYYVFEKSRKTHYWNTSDVLGLNLKAGF